MEIILCDKNLKKAFFEKMIETDSVVLCRLSPKQKAHIAEILKNEFRKIVCCVGDGGNDVGMIRASSVGIGIKGKEGL